MNCTKLLELKRKGKKKKGPGVYSNTGIKETILGTKQYVGFTLKRKDKDSERCSKYNPLKRKAKKKNFLKKEPPTSRWMERTSTHYTI